MGTTETPEAAASPVGLDPSSVTIATDAEIEAGIQRLIQAEPLATRHAIGKAALRVGVRQLVGDPTLVVPLLREQRGRVGGGRTKTGGGQ